jgi:hypothetical protein
MNKSNVLVSPPALVMPSVELASLASRINAEHAASEAALQQGLIRGKTAGELLIQAKERVPHGQWLQWLGANVKFTRRTATRYMQLAAKWDIVSHSDSMTEALAILAEPDSEPELVENTSSPTVAPSVAATSGKPALTRNQRLSIRDPRPYPVNEPLRNGHSKGTAPEVPLAQNEPGELLDAVSEVKDAAGREVPVQAIAAFLEADKFFQIGRDVDAVMDAVRELKDGPAGSHIDLEDARIKAKGLKGLVLQSRPTHVCCRCRGDKALPCKFCSNNGWMMRHTWEWQVAEMEREAGVSR